jgi:hypothetical protein
LGDNHSFILNKKNKIYLVYIMDKDDYYYEFKMWDIDDEKLKWLMTK